MTDTDDKLTQAKAAVDAADVEAREDDDVISSDELLASLAADPRVANEDRHEELIKPYVPPRATADAVDGYTMAKLAIEANTADKDNLFARHATLCALKATKIAEVDGINDELKVIRDALDKIGASS